MNRILIALSGGVDSSVAADLIQKKGYEIETCILIMRGVGSSARASARSVANHLGVVHHEFDVTQAFDDLIITDFINEYQQGRTPNPCVICNREIKLDILLKKSKELSCDLVATGHYARIEQKRDRYLLKRGQDENEQSYFLYRLQQSHLSHLLLPLGNMTRKEVESYARSKKLPSARRHKSQDICFVPGNNYPRFLEEFIKLKPGPIKDANGTTLGEHKGVSAYTIGQRRGLGISAPHPLYVMHIDIKNNAIIVGEEKDIYGCEAIVNDLCFIPFDRLDRAMEVYAKPRYVAALSPARIEPMAHAEAKVTFSQPQWALTPGQSVVFYQDDICIGGGMIQAVISGVRV